VRVCLEFEVFGNGNHYFANLLGLAAVECGLASSISPRRIDSLSQRFEREAVDETFSEGANFEGSSRLWRLMPLSCVAMGLKKLIRMIQDHPKSGLQFRDIASLVADPAGLSGAIEALGAPYLLSNEVALANFIDRVVGIDM